MTRALAVQGRGNVALGVYFYEQDLAAGARREQRGRRSHRALSDTAFAREEQTATIEQVRTRVDHERL